VGVSPNPTAVPGESLGRTPRSPSLITTSQRSDLLSSGRVVPPNGPLRLDPRPDDALSVARVGSVDVTDSDFVIADGDGVIFLNEDRLPAVVLVGEAIRTAGRGQALEMRPWSTLREKGRFGEDLAQRHEK